MTLDAVVVAAVLASAFLHASWNAIAKASSDPLLSIAIVTVTGGVVAAGFAPFVPVPGPAVWPWLAASLVLHLLYQLALIRGYGLGDLSQVYPIARGLAPLGVAVGAAAAGEVPTGVQAAGLCLASAGIMSLAWVPREGRRPRSALPTALLTALFIAGYTVVDGLGVRSARQASSYIVWMFLLDAIPIAIVAGLRRRGRVVAFVRAEGARAVGGGAMATAAYAVVLWALAQGAMAPVAALRETSVVFAAFLGTRLLGEPFGVHRMAAAVAVAAGLVLVQSRF